jgi:predicted GNAT family N-acyltransferase
LLDLEEVVADLTAIVCRQATLEEIYRLRFAVLRAGQPVVKVYFANDDAEPPVTWHFGAFRTEPSGLRNIGCLTYLASTYEGAPAMQLRGMAVDEQFRGQGIGGRLLDLAQEIVIAQGPRRLWCNARAAAVAFYERHGWRCVSEEFQVEGVGPHRRMFKNA